MQQANEKHKLERFSLQDEQQCRTHTPQRSLPQPAVAIITNTSQSCLACSPRTQACVCRHPVADDTA
jgi:hypothetical protein